MEGDPQVEVQSVQEHNDLYGGVQWLLTMVDGRGLHVVWPEATLIGRMSVTPWPALWSSEFSRSDNQVVAIYLPDEREKTWEVVKKYLSRKFDFGQLETDKVS